MANTGFSVFQETAVPPGEPQVAKPPDIIVDH
jgi:hypothetical protein